MPKLVGLQLLRAFAAVMVLIGHAIAEAEHYFNVSFHLDFIPWTRGVDIFFVISGFIITLSAKRFAGQPVAFLWRRTLRVVPLYYFFTTLMVITLIVLPNGPKDTFFDLGQVLSSYGFIPYARGDGRIAPILSLGWTLNYEMFFYVICAASLLFRHSLFLTCTTLVGCVVLGTVLEFDSVFWVFWSNPIVIEFVFGILLAKVYQSGWHKADGRIATLTFIAALALLIAFDQSNLPRVIAAGVPSALIVAAGTLLCPIVKSQWQILGDASYALYLSHRFTLRGATLLLVPVLPASRFGSWLYVGAVCLLSIGIAILVHLWLERPFLGPKSNRVMA